MEPSGVKVQVKTSMFEEEVSIRREGGLTLIKSMLANLPIYYTSLLTKQVKITKKTESIQCRLLWGDMEERRMYQLVSWNEIKKPMSLEGLRLRSFVQMNKALQGKWLWKFMKENDFLWWRVIEAIFGTIHS